MQVRVYPARLGTGLAVFCLAALVALGGCETVPDPVIPPRDKAASSNEARQLYEEYRLSKVGHTVWGAHYLQGLKPYKYGHQRLSHLFAASSEKARCAYRRGSNLVIFGVVLGGTGGGLAGYPIGSYMTTDDWGTQEYVMLGLSLVGAGVSLILTVLADDYFEEAVVEYNLDLRRTLGAP